VGLVTTPGAPPLVVFDLGGVLVRIRRSWAQACEAAGVAHRAGARAGDVVVEELVAAYQVGGLDDAGFFTAASRALGDCTPHEVERVHDAWLVGEYPGAGALLDALEAHDIETAILSNTNATHWRAMLAPHGAFPAVRRVRRPHASHLLGAAKPSREVFARFERAVGRSGSDVIFFEDSPANAAAARAHGWRAHVVDPAGDPPGDVTAVLRAAGIL
jgi:putative hydrolase of the HAD superfamily